MKHRKIRRKVIIILIIILLLLLCFLFMFFKMDDDKQKKSDNNIIEEKLRYKIKKISDDTFELYVYGKKVTNLSSNLKNGNVIVEELDDILVVIEYEEDDVKRIIAVNDNAEFISEFEYSLDGGSEQFINNVDSYELKDNILYINVTRNIKNKIDNWFCFVDDNEILNYKIKYQYLGDEIFSNKEIISVTSLSDEYNKDDCSGSFAVDLNGGKSSQKFFSKYEMDTVIELENPTKQGYIFNGWDLVYGNSILNNNRVMLKKGSTLIKALWSPINYKINFNLNGGVSEKQSIDAMYDKIIKIEYPEKKGYTFIGWKVTGDINKEIFRYGNSEANLDKSFDSSDDKIKDIYYKNLTDKASGNILFTALWKDDIKPNINYSLSNDNYSNQDVSIKYSFSDHGSGISSYLISDDEDSKDWIKCDTIQNEINGTYKVTGNGTYYIIVKDKDDNVTKQSIKIDNIDKKSPVITFNNSGGKYQKENYVNKKVSVDVEVVDEGISGISKLEYAWTNDNIVNPTTWTVFEQENGIEGSLVGGKHYLWIRALDEAGNQNIKVSNEFIIHGWQLYNEQDWYFYDETGNKLYGWQEVYGRPDSQQVYWYYLEESNDGKAAIGLRTIDSKVYYFYEINDVPGGKGSLATGWQKINDKYYYFVPSGEMQTGWIELNGKRYYLNDSGVMQTGFAVIKGSKYYFNSDGEMITGWLELDGTWYYLNSDGKIHTGWKTIGGHRYHFDNDGQMETGWVLYDGVNYYLYPEYNEQGGVGAAAVGWQVIDGKKYYFQSGGEMTISWLEIGGKWYHFEVSGEMTTGWRQLGGISYYLDQNGVMQTGWLDLDGNRYYLNSDGIMQTGWITLNGYKYHLKTTGELETGWILDNGINYYLYPENNSYGGKGAAAVGWQVINGKTYYFQSAGEMTVSWLQIGGKWYHFEVSGEMTTGWRQLGGLWYYMNADGVMQTDWIQVDGHWYYMNADGIMQTGWIQLKGIWYYLKPSGFTSWSGPEGSMLYSTTVTIDGVSYTFNADGACMNP